MKHILVVAMTLIVLLVSACLASALVLQENPGNLLVFELGPPILIPTFSLCQWIQPFTTATITVYGASLLEGYSGVTFDVAFEGNLLVLGRETADPDAVDNSESNDDHWELQFSGCRETEGFVPLVSYVVILTDVQPDTRWLCLSAPDQPEPTWTLCSGTQDPAGRFPIDSPPMMDGCFPINPTFECPVPTTIDSWSAVKARY